MDPFPFPFPLVWTSAIRVGSKARVSAARSKKRGGSRERAGNLMEERGSDDCWTERMS